MRMVGCKAYSAWRRCLWVLAMYVGSGSGECGAWEIVVRGIRRVEKWEEWLAEAEGRGEGRRQKDMVVYNEGQGDLPRLREVLAVTGGDGLCS